MPEKTPFHERTVALCQSYQWRDWAGYLGVSSYGTSHEPEYYAFRHAAGLLDVSPLFKYDVTGPDAAAFLSFAMTRSMSSMRPGRVAYASWCDGDGKMVDDGTVTCFAPDHFRVTAANPCLVWFERLSRGFDIRIEDISRRFGALSLQGPHSRAILSEVVDIDMSKLRFFRAKAARLAGAEVVVSRTGYTGDLGFEIWVEVADCLSVWDALMGAGVRHGITPAGLAALDMVRVEAGFVLAGVDYYNARHCVIEKRKSTPFELDLGWTVQVDRDPFVGQTALRKELQSGPTWRFVGLSMDWDEIEALYERHNLPAAVPSASWRTPTPVYASKKGKQIGYATSGTWSPILKQNLALAHIEAPHGELGDELQIEVTVEYERKLVTATVVHKPFFNPPRKRA